MRFTATIRTAGKTATGIAVPEDVVTTLGKGKKPPVSVTVAGYSYRTTVAVMGGEFLVPLSAEHRTAAGVAGGDTVDVDIELDTEPRVTEVPDDLAAALAAAKVREAFDALAPSRRKEWVRSVEEAKAAETRQRRIDKAVASLQAG